MIIDTPSAFRPPDTDYAGYAGPWIERAFHECALASGVPGNRSYIPVYWTNYLHTLKNGQAKPLNDYLGSLPRDRRYFTVIQHCLKSNPPEELGARVIQADDFYSTAIRLPPDTVLFSAGGPGGVVCSSTAIPARLEKWENALSTRHSWDLLTPSTTGSELKEEWMI